MIQEFTEAKYADVLQLPPESDIDGGLFTEQIEVVADRICDVQVLLFFERKDGGLKALADWIGRYSS